MDKPTKVESDLHSAADTIAHTALQAGLSRDLIAWHLREAATRIEEKPEDSDQDEDLPGWGLVLW